MEQSLGKTEGQDGDPSIEHGLWKFKTAVNRSLSERGVERFCDVSLSQKGNWFELRGTVDSHYTRSLLFSLVPKQNGRRYIIDKLKVTAPSTEKDMWI
jgi:hypothetical protein